MFDWVLNTYLDHQKNYFNFVLQKTKNFLRETQSQRRLVAPSPSGQIPKLGPDLIDYKSLNQLICEQTKGLFLAVGLRHHIAEVNVAALKDFFFISREKPLRILSYLGQKKKQALWYVLRCDSLHVT